VTFSIAARSADGQWWGVAVSSKVLAVGRAVPAAEAGVGAVATQARCNITFRTRGLRKLRDGLSAEDAVAQLIEEDDMPDVRQLGIVDRHGSSANHTGDNCIPWSGGCTGPGYAIQGNMLSGPDVTAAMQRAWLATDSTDPLGRRLTAALLAGDRAGGDKRGRQSAALLVVTEDGAYEGGHDVHTDLRVDDHLDPVLELSRLLDIAEICLDKTYVAPSLPLDGALLVEVAALLDRVGFRPDGDDRASVSAALARWAGEEFLSHRILNGDRVDSAALFMLRQKSAAGWTSARM
jgi:uncharacterized Ntn-hydrolase superfamily protein